MSLIPDEEMQKSGFVNLAPMVDFLFLIVALFAVFAVTRAALFDTEVNLVKIRPEKEGAMAPGYNDRYVVNLGVTSDGRYKWITEVSEFLLDSAPAIEKQLIKMQAQGELPQEKERTKVLLHIDKEATWDTIAQAIFTVREAGFEIHPVYEPTED
jgi:biopolymer transport protein ExbD